MGNSFGETLHLSIFGESHAPSIGMTLEGIPSGLPVDLIALQDFMKRRAPGQNPWSTSRKEADIPEFQSGISNGVTNGETISAIIHNTNTRSGDYENLKICPRPGHADYAAQVKYGGAQNVAGGGRFSGRLTAPMCIAGGLCKQWLAEMGIQIGAHIASIAHAQDDSFNPIHPSLSAVLEDFPVLNPDVGDAMKWIISEAQKEGDSVGGTIECAVTGIPAGLGGPLFDGIEGHIAQIIYSIPAVKSLTFGEILPYGSQNNDPFTVENGAIRTLTNHAGGILGGITNGMPLIFTVGIKPTPSISKPQQTVNLLTKEITTLQIKGRHDPCIVPRAVPVVEAAAAIAIYDLILSGRN